MSAELEELQRRLVALFRGVQSADDAPSAVLLVTREIVPLLTHAAQLATREPDAVSRVADEIEAKLDQKETGLESIGLERYAVVVDGLALLRARSIHLESLAAVQAGRVAEEIARVLGAILATVGALA